MNIDLLINKTQDVGIVTTGKFESAVTAAILDHENQTISLEFGETMDSMDMNVPIADDLIPYLNQKTHLFVIGTDKVHIHEAYRIPLMHINNMNRKDVGQWK